MHRGRLAASVVAFVVEIVNVIREILNAEFLPRIYIKYLLFKGTGLYVKCLVGLVTELGISFEAKPT